MSRWKPHKKPNYLDKVAESARKAQEAGRIKKGHVYRQNIYHDDWCDQLNGKGPCNCNPIVQEPFEEGSQN